MKNRTPAYWPTRILLAVGFIATVIALTWSLVQLTQGPMFDSRPAVLGLPRSIVVALVGLVPVLVGFAWILRIFRGPHDEPRGQDAMCEAIITLVVVASEGGR